MDYDKNEAYKDEIQKIAENAETLHDIPIYAPRRR